MATDPQDLDMDDVTAESQAAMEAGLLPIPRLPLLARVSGKYATKRHPFIKPQPIKIPSNIRIPDEFASSAGDQTEELEAADTDDLESTDAINLPFPLLRREEICLDVDGRYPQNTASGTIHTGLFQRVHWIAKLKKVRPSLWYGKIWHKDGATYTFKHTSVWIQAKPSFFPHLRQLKAVFSGGGVPSRSVICYYRSAYFHKVEFEYDCEAGVTPVLEIDSGEHNNRPAGMPTDSHLTIEKIFKHAGIGASRSAGSSVIPNDGPDPNTTWSDAEMHDAMQTYWSRFKDRPQWAMWILMALRHDMGAGLGGIMFDDIGPNHRQGTAVFNDSFIANPPAGEAQPAAWVKRMKLWTAVHEMGHGFNLAHSWQKHMGTPWIPLASEPEARSFMNYPYNVAGGEAAFFADFEYRFSDMELLFMRHAPARFVQMGNADWFDDHGFENAAAHQAGQPDFNLSVSHNHSAATFEFLEQVVLELTLTNVTPEPKIVPESLLADADNMTVILKKDGKPARQWHPYARRMLRHQPRVLQPGETITDTLHVSAGLNGWDISEPGHYTVQLAIAHDGDYIVSNAYRLKVATPTSRMEERLAQDLFTEDTGRVLAFGGSKFLTGANDTLKEIVKQLPKSKAAVHAQVALAMPLTRNYRQLDVAKAQNTKALGGDGIFQVSNRQIKVARKELSSILVSQAENAAETLGTKDFERYCMQYSQLLQSDGDAKAAKEVTQAMAGTLSKLGKARTRTPVAAE